jgi:tRNA 5-methylaminomethyl-2-thiouridine biosynthesis bifunctional protein
MVGSTFEKWVDHTHVIDKDHQENIETLQNYLSFLKGERFEIDAGWAGMRVATNDRFPVIGAVPETDDIYVSTAFGSHGLVGSLAGAHYLADLVRNGPKSLSQKSYNALNPKRFLDRAKKRGHNQ